MVRLKIRKKKEKLKCSGFHGQVLPLSKMNMCARKRTLNRIQIIIIIMREIERDREVLWASMCSSSQATGRYKLQYNLKAIC